MRHPVDKTTLAIEHLTEREPTLDKRVAGNCDSGSFPKAVRLTGT
jgi:hypothetical protein